MKYQDFSIYEKIISSPRAVEIKVYKTKKKNYKVYKGSFTEPHLLRQWSFCGTRFTRFVYIFRDYYKNVLSYIVLHIWLYCLYKFTRLYFSSNKCAALFSDKMRDDLNEMKREIRAISEKLKSQTTSGEGIDFICTWRFYWVLQRSVELYGAFFIWIK